jgi:hypothetical protein
MARFDEIELDGRGQAVLPVAAGEIAHPSPDHASRFRRLLALLTDLSLFVALSLALSPLLPSSKNWLAVAALAGFIIVVSYYYFVGTWLLWGKTIGGVIFDIRVIPAGTEAMALKNATRRWAGVMLSLLAGGIGFALAALPSRLSLPDRLSDTRCVAAG